MNAPFPNAAPGNPASPRIVLLHCIARLRYIRNSHFCGSLSSSDKLVCSSGRLQTISSNPHPNNIALQGDITNSPANALSVLVLVKPLLRAISADNVDAVLVLEMEAIRSRFQFNGGLAKRVPDILKRPNSVCIERLQVWVGWIAGDAASHHPSEHLVPCRIAGHFRGPQEGRLFAYEKSIRLMIRFSCRSRNFNFSLSVDALGSS